MKWPMFSRFAMSASRSRTVAGLPTTTNSRSIISFADSGLRSTLRSANSRNPCLRTLSRLL